MNKHHETSTHSAAVKQRATKRHNEQISNVISRFSIHNPYAHTDTITLGDLNRLTVFIVFSLVRFGFLFFFFSFLLFVSNYLVYRHLISHQWRLHLNKDHANTHAHTISQFRFLLFFIFLVGFYFLWIFISKISRFLVPIDPSVVSQSYFALSNKSNNPKCIEMRYAGVMYCLPLLFWP